MQQLLLAAGAFFFLHRIVSASGLRAILVRRVGPERFRRWFAAASALCLAWLILGYWLAVTSAPNPQLFPPLAGADWVQWPLQYCALLLVIAGVRARNPATAGQLDAVHEDVVHGVLRITRHPFLWGVMLSSAGHAVALGDRASCTFFGTLFLLAFIGTFSIDAKRSAALGADWSRFTAQTSNVPFAAMARGRQRLVVAEMGWTLPAVTLAVFLVVVALHELSAILLHA